MRNCWLSSNAYRHMAESAFSFEFQPAGAARLAVRGLACVAFAGFVAGCAQTPQQKGHSKEFFSSSIYGRASERVVAEGEPVPHGGGQYLVGRPYTIAGKRYVPTSQPRESQIGMASYYGGAFHGRRTANGEIYDMNSVTAAHPTLPLPSYARVTNMRNGRSIIVRVNDRGPYHSGRVMDVSSKVAEALAFKSIGTAQIKVEYIGKAGLQGSDDNKLLASLRTDGRPAVLDGSPSLPPTMIARNVPAQAPAQPAPQRIALAEEAAAPLQEPSPVSPLVSAPRIAAMPANVPLPPSRPFDLGLSGGQTSGAWPRTALFDSTPQSPLLALRKDPIAEVLMLPPRRP
jgi:rare lipoprotein A